METPDPPNDTPGASKQVVLTPHDIPRILRDGEFFQVDEKKTLQNAPKTFNSGWNAVANRHVAPWRFPRLQLFGCFFRRSLYPMKDPWDDCTVYLHENHKNSTIHIGIYIYIIHGSYKYGFCRQDPFRKRIQMSYRRKFTKYRRLLSQCYNECFLRRRGGAPKTWLNDPILK